MMTPEEVEHRRKLAAVAVELGAEVARLTAASQVQAEATASLAGEIERKTWKTTIKIRWMIALVVLDLILTGAAFVSFIKISELVHDQEVVRAQVLCPLYSIFLGSYQPETRTAGPDRDKYEVAFKAMWDQYGVLHCSGPLVPPRRDLVTITPPPK
jgi:hypothetical protein